MKKSQRSPYTRLATSADKQTWSRYFPAGLVGFVPITDKLSGIVHWAVVSRYLGINNKHILHCLCNYSWLGSGKETPTATVSCMTCIIRIERGPSASR